MPFVAPYIPVKQGDYDTWLANFATLIAAGPATYGLTAGEAAIISASYVDWHAAYLLVTSPATKTASTVIAKDAQRVLSLATARVYAQRISQSPGVSMYDKTAVGVNPRTSVPTPILAPVTAPDLSVQSAIPLTLYMRFRDPVTAPKVKAKPYGVTRMQLFGALSATPIVDPTLLPWFLDATKSPFVAGFAGGDSGKRFYYSGRWVVRTGLAGPMSAIGSFLVP